MQRMWLGLHQGSGADAADLYARAFLWPLWRSSIFFARREVSPCRSLFAMEPTQRAGFTHTVITARRAAELLRCSLGTASRALAALVGQGILESSEGKRGRVFVSRAAVELLQLS